MLLNRHPGDQVCPAQGLPIESDVCSFRILQAVSCRETEPKLQISWVRQSRHESVIFGRGQILHRVGS